MPYIGDSYVVRIQDPVTNITSITNASLKMGRDTDNLIDFATTDNEIVLRVSGTDVIKVTSEGNFNLIANNTELRFYEGANYVGFEAPALSANQIWVLPSADGTSGQALTTNASGTLSWSDVSSSNSSIDVTHSSHGLAVGDVIRPSSTNNQYTKSQADTEANAEVIGIVTTVTDSNNYTMVINGEVSTAAAVPNSAAGTVLYLSSSSAGALTATEPTTATQVSKPVAIVTEQNAKMVLLPFRGEKIGTGLATAAPNSVNYLVGTASADLSGEIVVGTSPGGELGGSWASPTIDDNIIDEANLKVSNSPTDGQFLSAQSGNTGGLTWASAGVSENDVIIMTEIMMYS